MEQKSEIQKQQDQDNQSYNQEYSDLSLIDIEILDNIFKSEDKQQIQTGLKQLKQFVKDNKPSYQLFLSILNEYFQTKNGTKMIQELLLNKLPFLLPQFGKAQTNSFVYKIICQIISENQKELQNLEQIKKQLADKSIWQNYNLDAFPNFIQTFQMQELIDYQQQTEYIQQLINKQKFNDCVLVIQAFGSDKQQATLLVKSMVNNKTASKAADYLKKFKLDPKDFPDLKQRLEKNCLRYFLREKQWYQIEDMFCEQPHYIGYAAEDYFFKGQHDIAYTLEKKYNLIKNGYMVKEDIITSIKAEEELQNLKIIPNPIIENDSLNPMEEIAQEQPQGTYLNLKDFGIQKENIIIIDTLKNNQEQIEKASKDLLNSTELGLDCEFATSFTKLDKKSQDVCLIQIGNDKNIYLIDIYTLNKNKENLQQLSDLFSQIFENGKIIKIGVGIAGDFSKICNKKCLNIKNSVQGFLELQNLYIKEHKGAKQSSLNHISTVVLGKSLSKGEQTSNWERRPLRQCQIHYAAMDAIISVKILQKLREKLGEQVIKSYISEICNSAYNESESNSDQDI